MKNVYLLILVLLVLIYFYYTSTEYFSDSGLPLSNYACNKITDVYYRPWDNNENCRKNYRQSICSKCRRQIVEPTTGNYFTENGVLV